MGKPNARIEKCDLFAMLGDPPTSVVAKAWQRLSGYLTYSFDFSYLLCVPRGTLLNMTHPVLLAA
jgi:hypothetical protein